MVTLVKKGVLLLDIQRAISQVGRNHKIVSQFYSVFTFPLVDVYSGTWTEVEDFLEEKGIKIKNEGILLSQTSSLHYVAKGKRYVGYIVDELGNSRVLLESTDLEPVM